MKIKLAIVGLCLLSISVSANEMATPSITGKIALMDIASSGNNVYFTCAVEEEEKQIRFFSFNANTWNEILLPQDTKASGFLSLKIHKNIPYILFNGNEGVTLIKYEAETWHHVGKANFSAESGTQSFLDFHFKGDEPYVIFENQADKKINIVSLEINGNLQIWISPDAADAIPAGTEQPFMCMDNNETIYTVWMDRAKEKVSVSKMNEDETELIDLSKGFPSKNVANLVGFRCIGNALYLAYEDKTKSYGISVHRFNIASTKWELLSTPSSMEGTAFIMHDNANVYLSNREKKIMAFKFENNTWANGEEISSDATNIKTAFNGVDTYIAFLNSNQKLTIIKR